MRRAESAAQESTPLCLATAPPEQQHHQSTFSLDFGTFVGSKSPEESAKLTLTSVEPPPEDSKIVEDTGLGQKPRKQSIHMLSGVRMKRRRILFGRREMLGDVTCVTSVLGWILAVVNTELCMANVASAASPTSQLLKLVISSSTLVSLISILAYSFTELQIHMLNNLLEDWRMAISRPCLLRLFAELLICSIHPLPFEWSSVPFKKRYVDSDWFPEGTYVCDGEWDAFLTIFMICRLYVVCRCVMLHNKFFSDLHFQSIGALNKVRVNFFFIFKTYLIKSSGMVFAVLICLQLCWSAWSFRACEAYVKNPLRYFLNSFYLSAVTFTTLGYGDLTGKTTCGKSIAIITAFCGVAGTALTVAVLTSRLEMSRNEKYYYSFMMALQGKKEHQFHSANVIKFTWKVFKSRTLKPYAWQHVHYQRKLDAALAKMRSTKEQQSPFLDVTMQLHDLQCSQQSLMLILRDLQSKLHSVQNSLRTSVESKN